ncbi:MAG: putative lipoprotein [Cyanobacteria bacterium RYN_339]|nr:putative lipoprotein [Cyanobacteria bacterium RYN_339]
MAIAAIVVVLFAVRATRTVPHDAARAAARPVPVPEIATRSLSIVVRGHPLESGPPPSEFIGPYMDMLRWELARYPAGALGTLQLQQIVVCDKLTSGGVSFDAMADWDAHILYLTALDLAHEDNHARVVVHHEAFHLLDQAQTGNLADDAAWTALNEAGFNYGSGGDSMRQLGAGDVGSSGRAGFVSAYATTGVDEDKAETYGHLMIDRTWVLRQAARDPALARKLGVLKQRLNGYVRGWGDKLGV